MATIFLRVKAPNSGFFFVGNYILREESWTPVDIDGLSWYMRETIISALLNGYIKGDKLNSEIIEELQGTLTRREIEAAVKELDIGTCCCVSTMLIDPPRISSHHNGENAVPVPFALTVYPYQTTEAYAAGHTSTSWEVTSDPNFEEVSWSSYEDEINKLYIVVNGLSNSKTYYLRAKFISGLYHSVWSESIIIHTAQPSQP